MSLLTGPATGKTCDVAQSGGEVAQIARFCCQNHSFGANHRPSIRKSYADLKTERVGGGLCDEREGGDTILNSGTGSSR